MSSQFEKNLIKCRLEISEVVEPHIKIIKLPK